MNVNTIILLPLTCSALISSCATEAPKGPNVVFIMADQWRRQAAGFMNEDPVKTPFIDALANESAVFDNAVASVPVSGPNRACLLTGQYTINNGVWANGVPLNPHSDASLGNALQAEGYVTGYVGKWHLNGIYDEVVDEDRRHGFDFWYQSLGHRNFTQPYYDPIKGGVEVVRQWSPKTETDKALEFLAAHKDEKFGLVVSFAPPHQSAELSADRWMPGKRNKSGEKGYTFGYQAPAEYEAIYKDIDFDSTSYRPNRMPMGEGDSLNQAAAGYFGAITAIDFEIGRVIKYLKDNDLYDNTIVVITSDHGDMMGSHSRTGKGIWYEESVGVPLIVEYGDKVGKGRYSESISSISVLPTILSLANIQIPEMVDGYDYGRLVTTGDDPDAPEYCFMEYNYGGVKEAASRYWRAIYSKRFTYVLCGMNRNRSLTKDGCVLYDKERDPYQMNPITRGEGYDDVIDKMDSLLTKHLAEIDDPFIAKYWNEKRPDRIAVKQSFDQPTSPAVRLEAVAPPKVNE